jgi:hypothetical protein
MTRCFAVGSTPSVNFVDVLNGTKWTSVTLTKNSYQGLRHLLERQDLETDRSGLEGKD